jgi:hypothetical protein
MKENPTEEYLTGPKLTPGEKGCGSFMSEWQGWMFTRRR